MPKDYGSWLLTDLRAELRRRKVKAEGRKVALVQRLHDCDVLFGDLVNNPESAYHIKLPDPSEFADVNSDTHVPILTDADLKVYTQISGREDLVTPKNLYEECYLITCRAANCEDICYVSGVCAAEMRKSVQYNIVVKFSVNVILEAQCECAAGMGPHAQCKHVLVLMYGIIDFATKKYIKIHSCPTATLQKFHKPATLYRGKALKINEIKLSNKVNLNIATFDPRVIIPNRQKFVENFKSAMVNFAASCSTKETIPFLCLLIEPANIKAVCQDHDYLEKTHEEYFLNSFKIDKQQIAALQKKTIENKVLWKKERQMRLQSSNFGKICKAKGNKKKLANSFLVNNDITSTSLMHGLKYEPVAFNQISQKYNIQIEKCGLFVHEDYQFLAATSDGLVGDDTVIEIKCPYTAKDSEITHDTVPYIHFCETDGQLKLSEQHDYYYQLQGQLLCTNRRHALFCIYTFCDLKIIKIERNEKFIGEMLNNLKEFYDKEYKNQFLNRYLYNIKISS